MKKHKDLTGIRFDNFVVVKLDRAEQYAENRYKYFWVCLCDCGKEFIRGGTQIIAKTNNKSCGCIREKINAENRYKHGFSKTRFNNIYHNMKNRVLNEKGDKYKYYGGRGIKICDEWKNDFINFKNDMYESYLKHIEKHGEKNTTLERIDVNGNYDPNNCKWATVREQTNNTRNNKEVIATNLKTGETHKGKIGYLSEKLGMKNNSHVYSVLKGKRKSTGGYKFEYVIK